MLRRWTVHSWLFRFNSTLANSPAHVPEEHAPKEKTFNQSSIAETIKINPNLEHVPFDVWQQAHNVFSEYGFKTRNFIDIISKNPKLLSRPVAKIQQSLEFWRGCQFGETRVENLIYRYPSLLDILADRDVQIQINNIKSLVDTTKNVWIILMNSPNILQDDFKTIEEQFNYMRDVMRLDVSEIVKSEAFSFTLDEIKTRHVFLERLGIFKPRSPKAPPGEISKNPRLHQIMDRSESKFASKVALVSLAEFEAFKELFRRELERNRDDENSDSDNDY